MDTRRGKLCPHWVFVRVSLAYNVYINSLADDFNEFWFRFLKCDYEIGLEVKFKGFSNSKWMKLWLFCRDVRNLISLNDQIFSWSNLKATNFSFLAKASIKVLIKFHHIFAILSHPIPRHICLAINSFLRAIARLFNFIYSTKKESRHWKPQDLNTQKTIAPPMLKPNNKKKIRPIVTWEMDPLIGDHKRMRNSRRRRHHTALRCCLWMEHFDFTIKPSTSSERIISSIPSLGAVRSSSSLELFIHFSTSRHILRIKKWEFSLFYRCLPLEPWALVWITLTFHHLPLLQLVASIWIPQSWLSLPTFRTNTLPQLAVAFRTNTNSSRTNNPDLTKEHSPPSQKETVSNRSQSDPKTLTKHLNKTTSNNSHHTNSPNNLIKLSHHTNKPEPDTTHQAPLQSQSWNVRKSVKWNSKKSHKKQVKNMCKEGRHNEL